MPTRRTWSWASRSLPFMPVTAESALRIPLTQSLDQRTPQRLFVVEQLSTHFMMPASSVSRGVTRPCTSPSSSDFTAGSRGMVRLTTPASIRSTAKLLPTTQPIVRSHPTTDAMRSSLMPFWAETT